MGWTKLTQSLPTENNLAVKPRPYFNHSVQFKKTFSARERIQMLSRVGLNVFFFPSEMVTGCDLLSDSGTTTMTNDQWAALHLGDEAYGSNQGYFLLQEQIAATFGPEFAQRQSDKTANTFIFHQGRAAEEALFGVLGRLSENQIIPSNGHFDTTQANIESRKMTAVNLFSPSLKRPASKDKFKGNMDTARLREMLAQHQAQIPLIMLTITNNTGGGQPVSLENIREVHALSREFSVPFFFDACRFAENAWFIKKNEPGYSRKSILEIVAEMFSYVDGFTISFKKDGLANMGGGVFLRRGGLFLKKYPTIADELVNLQILKEGHPTYGGMSGRDIMALVEGLKVVTKDDYLEHRIGQVERLGQALAEAGLPVIMPAGGHAAYLDMTKFFADTKMKPEEFGGIAFAALLLGFYGHRVCELGNLAFGHYDQALKKEILPEVNFIRLAVPRLRYEEQDLQSVVEAVSALYQQRHKIPKIKVTYGRDLPLRHFKARFEFL